MLEFFALGLAISVALILLQKDSDLSYHAWSRNHWQEQCGIERQKRLNLERAIQLAAKELKVDD